MDHDDGDLGAVVRAGRAHPNITSNWPSLPTDPGPLNFATSAASFFPHFPPSSLSPTSFLQCRRSSLLFSNLLGTAPAYDHHDMYPSFIGINQPRPPPISAISDKGGALSTSFSFYTGLPESPHSLFACSTTTEKKLGDIQAYYMDVEMHENSALSILRNSKFSDPFPDTKEIAFTVAEGNVKTSSSTALSAVSTSTVPETCSEAVSNSLLCDSPVRQPEPTTVQSKIAEEASSPVKQESLADSAVTKHSSGSKSQVSKRRKAQQKRVVCVPAPGGTGKPTGECLPSDLWAWRKYGQKPIKGSPYPRGYYRCSSSKGCSARKQVERSRTDPSMLMITYTSDHNHPWPTHRNALAGSSRQSYAEKSGNQASETAATACEPSSNNGDTTENPFCSIIGSPDLTEDAQGVSQLAMSVDEAFSLHGQDGTLHVLRSDVKREEDFFAELEELPESFTIFGRQAMDDKSDDEGGSAMIDPYNLFNWSSSSFAGSNAIR